MRTGGGKIPSREKKAIIRTRDGNNGNADQISIPQISTQTESSMPRSNMFPLDACPCPLLRPCIAIDTQLADAKAAPTHLFVHQRHTVEIIQLTEVPAPAPSRFPASPVDSSSAASSSSYCTTETESAFPTEDAESLCSSYCSSDEPEASSPHPSHPAESFDIRATRVLAWRTKSASDMAHGTPPSLCPPIPTHPSSDLDLSSPSKRKAADDRAPDDDDDVVPCVSLPKRPRSLALGPALCTACDAAFPSRPALRAHGAAPGAHEACRAAVAYDFE
ncbi:hypothetical protein HWV62_19585 [Athelia sp. TMB]|nr:hypothetical protein HWV62_19585 [Athelia sp. TMB]